MKTIRVETRSGKLEPLNPNKYHQHVADAVKGFDVSMSEIESDAVITFVDGIKSKDIQQALLNSTVDKIYENPDYQIPAGRLLNQQLRNIVYNQFEPLPFIEMIDKNIERGIYDGEYLFEHYTREELIEFGSKIDYTIDEFTTYTALKVDFDSYLIKQHGVHIETPQELNMLINLFAFAKYKDKYSKEFRKEWVLKGYYSLSKGKASLPTPIMKQLRTIFRKFLSCVTVPMGDTKYTIANASRAIYILVADGAGIGLGAYDMRGLDADIDNGRMKHTGTFQVLKAFEKTTKAFTQPDRHGSTTVFYPFFHIEVEKYCVLGNAKGTGDTRIRDMDHAIMFNDYFFERYANGEEITLFFMNDVPDIMSYIGDYDEFKKRYEYAEKTIPLERQTKISSSAFFNLFNDETILQARLYSTLMDNVKNQGMFKVPIKQSNLCLEINVPNYPIIDIMDIKRNIVFHSEKDKIKFYDLRREAYFHSTKDEDILHYQKAMRECYDFEYADLLAPIDESKPYDYFTLEGYVNLSEIGVCILAGINMGMCDNDYELMIVSEYLIRLEDELIDYMDYGLPEIEKAAKMRRTVGIGFSDVFHMLAKNKVKYNTVEGRQLFNDKVELCSFIMLKTNIQLAKDFGPCILYKDTKYSDGLTLFDTYNRNTDELLDTPSKQDWDSLKPDLLKYGVRLCTMLANAPFGTSSYRSGSQAGIEPPRGLIAKKDGVPKIIPDIGLYDEYWTTSWSDEFNNIDYLKFVSIGQKWIDQGMSVNRYQNLLKYKDNKIPMSTLIDEMLVCRYYGNKSTYYNNIKSKTDDVKDKLENDENLEMLEDDSMHVTVTDSKPSITEVYVDEEESLGCEGGSCSI